MSLLKYSEDKNPIIVPIIAQTTIITTGSIAVFKFFTIQFIYKIIHTD